MRSDADVKDAMGNKLAVGDKVAINGYHERFKVLQLSTGVAGRVMLESENGTKATCSPNQLLKV